MKNPFRPVQSPAMRSERLHPGYNYREYLPSERLSSHVACYWTVEFDAQFGGSQLHRIIPDGCVDIVVDRRASSAREAAFVAGLMTSYLVIELEGRQSSFGIRMFPEGARSILRAPASAFSSQRVYLEEIWGAAGRSLGEEFLHADNVSELIGIAEHHMAELLSRLSSPTILLPESVRDALGYIYDCKGVLSSAGVADKLGFSERHLRRTFERELGIGPKEMLGIVRFQSMLRDIHAGAGARLDYADLSAQYGFYDQSHLIKTFKKYYGMPPMQIWRGDGPE